MSWKYVCLLCAKHSIWNAWLCFMFLGGMWGLSHWFQFTIRMFFINCSQMSHGEFKKLGWNLFFQSKRIERSNRIMSILLQQHKHIKFLFFRCWKIQFMNFSAFLFLFLSLLLTLGVSEKDTLTWNSDH